MSLTGQHRTVAADLQLTRYRSFTDALGGRSQYAIHGTGVLMRAINLAEKLATFPGPFQAAYRRAVQWA
jgi:hypothetical protein